MSEPWIDAAWIRGQLSRTGKTQRALAQALGLDPSSVSRLLDGARHLKAHEIPKIVSFFEGKLHGSDQDPKVDDTHHSAAPSLRSSTGKSSPEDPAPLSRNAPGHPVQRRSPGPRPRTKLSDEIAVLGPLTALGGGLYTLRGHVAEHRACPPQLLGVAGAFALFIPDGALAPRFGVGEVIYIHPHKPPMLGAWVVLRLRSPEGRVAIGELVVLDETHVELRSGCEKHGFRRDEIGQIGRILVSSTE